MSNTVITNYTDLNGPSTKADSSVVVIVNKDGSLSVDQNLLGTLMGSDGSQGAGISVVRVGHEGKPDDATDSESDDDKVPHVTLSVDSYYDEPNSIIKYDSGAEMLQSLRIETRENSLVGFQNDHCYTTLTSPSQGVPQRSDSYPGYDEPIIEITHTPPPKPVPQSKKITIIEQQIIPKGKKILLNPSQSSVLLKGNDVLNKPMAVLPKPKQLSDPEKSSESTDSSSISSGESVPDRDSDSDYRDTTDRSGSLRSVRKSKLKPRILKNVQATKTSKQDQKIISRIKTKQLMKRDKEKVQHKNSFEKISPEADLSVPKESLITNPDVSTSAPGNEVGKVVIKQTPKPVKKEKKTPAHMTALLSDMTSLFSTPDVIRRVSTDGKTPIKLEKEPAGNKKGISVLKLQEASEGKMLENADKARNIISPKTYAKQKEKVNPSDKVTKGYDIPQLDDASLAQILQDTTGISSNPAKIQPNIATGNIINSPGLAGPLSPTLDLLGGLQPEEEGLTEDLLMHVAQLVESSENLQEVIDKQVLGKVDSVSAKTAIPSPFQQQQQHQTESVYPQTPSRSVKTIAPRKDPIEIVRRDGRVITLPPIEAPATRSSKRKSQMEVPSNADVLATPTITTVPPAAATPELQVQNISKQYVNKKLTAKKQEQVVPTSVVDKISAESQESWNSEDDPYRLWCICKQPHNNRFMICCDGCEDWFHGKCVNITKAMGQQMEEQGIEWRCPNCIKKTKSQSKSANKPTIQPQKKHEVEESVNVTPPVTTKEASSKTSCIVCKRSARASSIYCSDACILKHAQDSLGNQISPSKSAVDPGSSQEKQKLDSRVIVYERKTGRLLAGPNAPTAENLKNWLQKNPTFEVVRPGTLHTIKPNLVKKKSLNEQKKIQTTLNFERIPRKSAEQPSLVKSPQSEAKERMSTRVVQSPREEIKPTPQSRTPITPRSQPPQFQETPKPSTSSAKMTSEQKKPARATTSRSQSVYEKAHSVSPLTSRRKEAPDAKKKMDSDESIRENVRKSLQEQMSLRMAETTDGLKFTEEEIQQFAYDTEEELHELFRDVGVKYKAKYRSLMFNIKDRKNLTLWDKICDGTITPKQLVRLSPEELASQELAQWRDKEAKHQLELIKKSELDLLAANKTYVLKTHKGEEVMETKESVSTELDPNVPVEDLVTALNDSDVLNEISTEPSDTPSKPDKADSKRGSNKKRDKKESTHSKKSSRESKRDSDRRKSRSSRRQSDTKERESRSTRRRSEKKSSRARSLSKERSKGETIKEKEKSDSRERSRHRSRSRAKSKRRSKSREHSRSNSKGRERSRSRDHSHSRDNAKRRRSSRHKLSPSIEEKVKHRSRSQENTKTKNDSTDSDSIERPKSAMLKEPHPEYDPHEPMITSAFSEEDLRKSGGDSYEENYKNEIGDYGDTEYDASKAFDIENSVMLSTPKYSGKPEKLSEVESDQEPSSTVDNSALTVWNGCINMVDVARFYVAAHEVSGSAADLEEDLTAELDIVGRINPETVWDYISKMKRASNKDIVILRLQAANDEEKMQYIALYSYLSSRNRLGVVKVSNTATVKDFYIVPLPANTALPSVLLPLDGPGLADIKTHLLLAIVIRQRRKRPAAHIPKDIIPAKVARESRKRSYTPPVIAKSSYTPPTSPRRRSTLPLPAYTSPALSTSVKDKIAASLAAADDDEAYSPGSSSSGGSAAPPPGANMLRSKMKELNRQIEEQKQQILKMAQADSSIGEDEAYSPSRPMTPPAVVPLSDIALPSNLQEILATIKQRSENTANATADVDMRNVPPLP